MNKLNNGHRSQIVKYHNNGRTIPEISQSMKLSPRDVRKFLEGRKGFPGHIKPANDPGMRIVDRRENATYVYGHPMARVTLPPVAFLDRRLEWEM